MSLGLATFDHLVASVNTLERLRDAHCAPGSDQWSAMTTLVFVLDTLIDAVVMTFPEEEDCEAASIEPPVTKEPWHDLHD